MVQTSQLGISKYKWWMEIWKSWHSLQPSTFTGIPLPGGADCRKYELVPSPLWLQHVQPQSPVSITFDNSQEPESELQTTGDIRYLDSRMLQIRSTLRSCLQLVFINNSGLALAQLKCLAICHLVSKKMTSHLQRTEPSRWLGCQWTLIIRLEDGEYLQAKLWHGKLSRWGKWW